MTISRAIHVAGCKCHYFDKLHSFKLQWSLLGSWCFQPSKVKRGFHLTAVLWVQLSRVHRSFRAPPLVFCPFGVGAGSPAEFRLILCLSSPYSRGSSEKGPRPDLGTPPPPKVRPRCARPGPEDVFSPQQPPRAARPRTPPSAARRDARRWSGRSTAAAKPDST